MSRISRYTAIPVLILVVGLVLALMLVASRKTPPRQKRVWLGPLVEAVPVSAADVPVTVHGTGTVRARISVQLVPQVSGRIVEVHPAMTAGGFFRAGEPLVVIESTDYELAVRRAEAAVERARVQLQQAEAQAEVARREWDRIHPGEEPSSPLVLRIPQLEQARAELHAAEADLETARLNLERTRLSLPFDGRVVTKSADLGQYVTPGQPVATVYGSRSMEIPVPLRDSELAWIDVPGPGRDASRGAEVTVTAEFAGREHTWKGRVTRTEGQVDPATRMVHVVVEVDDPFAEGRPALMPGMFVRVAIHGHTLENAFVIPRHAVHEGGVAWVAREGRLRLTPVRVARFDRDLAVITGGLADGDLVVTSQLEVVTDGMKIRVVAPGEGAGRGTRAPDTPGGAAA